MSAGEYSLGRRSSWDKGKAANGICPSTGQHTERGSDRNRKGKGTFFVGLGFKSKHSFAD